MTKEDVAKIVFNSANAHAKRLLGQIELMPAPEDEKPSLAKIFEEAGILPDRKEEADIKNLSEDNIKEILERRSREVVEDPQTKVRLLAILDQLWMNHLEELDVLSGAVGLRAYGQKDPLVEYRQESRRLYGDFWNNFNGWVFMNIFRLAENARTDAKTADSRNFVKGNNSSYSFSPSGKVGRNDPCPCGAKHPDGRPKKYKHCHGK
jgi:preprotein translocase subunit SecA